MAAQCPPCQAPVRTSADRSSIYVNPTGLFEIGGPDERWAIERWCQNILNTDYSQVIFDSALQNIFSAFLAEPRTYGVTARFRF